MIARTQLSPDYQKLLDDISPYTIYEANSRTRHWEYPWVMTQVNQYLEDRKKTIDQVSIVEMGAANSCMQFYYSLKGASFTSVDPSKEAFDYSIAKKLGVSIDYIVGAFEDVDFEKKFDLVLNVSVMEHTERGKEKKILENIARILKPKGRAICTLDWFFDHNLGESCKWGYNPNCKYLIDESKRLGLKMILGDKKYLSGYEDFNEKEIKKEAFVLKVCNGGIWLTSQAFVLEKVK